jgi:hypothetical protein
MQRFLPDKTQHSKKTDIGVELATTASQWPKTDALDGTAHGIGLDYILLREL